VRFDWRIFERDGFLAGPDEHRLVELQAALNDPDVSAIVAARGGYGLTRIAPELELSGLLRAPKWLVGFSDFTALHVEAGAHGVASLHAFNAAELGRGDARARAQFIEALERPVAERELVGKRLIGGRARGRLAGGNLTVLFTCAAMGRLRLPEGCILAIEDVTEISYRIDRMLSALRSGGHLRGIIGVAVGSFSDCPPGAHGVAVDQVLACELRRWGLPAVTELPFGHARPNLPLLFGAEAELDGDSGTLRLGAESVQG
jgi:muramoyltetrapeptide carboxypeptidase